MVQNIVGNRDSKTPRPNREIAAHKVLTRATPNTIATASCRAAETARWEMATKLGPGLITPAMQTAAAVSKSVISGMASSSTG